jgi:hypothetical protein
MESIKFIISRNYREKETTGSALIFNADEKLFEFKTIELPLFTVPLKPNTACTNCIPEGTYEVTKIYSPTKGQCFQVHNVPGRTAILIHKGNYATGFKKVDTQGCILVGSKFEDINGDGELDIAESTITLTELLRILPNKFKIIIC